MKVPACRKTSKDMLNMLGRTLDTKIVEEMREARTGGEYAACLGRNEAVIRRSGDQVLGRFFVLKKRKPDAAPLIFGDVFQFQRQSTKQLSCCKHCSSNVPIGSSPL